MRSKCPWAPRTSRCMHSDTLSVSISACVLNGSLGTVVAARSSAFSREARYLLAFAFKLSECLSRSSDALIGSCRASHARQATREKRVRDPIHYCNMCLALHARTSEGRGDPRSPSHTADALIGSCRASYARQASREKRVRETIHYCNMPCIACSNERGMGGIHIPLPTVQAH